MATKDLQSLVNFVANTNGGTGTGREGNFCAKVTAVVSAVPPSLPMPGMQTTDDSRPQDDAFGKRAGRLAARAGNLPAFARSAKGAILSGWSRSVGFHFPGHHILEALVLHDVRSPIRERIRRERKGEYPGYLASYRPSRGCPTWEMPSCLGHSMA